jgi:hypothetical protein
MLTPYVVFRRQGRRGVGAQGGMGRDKVMWCCKDSMYSVQENLTYIFFVLTLRVFNAVHTFGDF